LPSARVTAPEDARYPDGKDGDVPVNAYAVRVSATTRLGGTPAWLGSLHAEMLSVSADARATDETSSRDFMSWLSGASEQKESKHTA